MQSVDREVSGMGCRVWSVDCGVCSAECGVQSEECELCSVRWGLYVGRGVECKVMFISGSQGLEITVCIHHVSC